MLKLKSRVTTSSRPCNRHNASLQGSWQKGSLPFSTPRLVLFPCWGQILFHTLFPDERFPAAGATAEAVSCPEFDLGGASNRTTDSHGWQELKHLSHLLPPPMMCISRKLETEAEPSLNPRHSNMGCRLPRQSLDHCAKPPLLSGLDLHSFYYQYS